MYCMKKSNSNISTCRHKPGLFAERTLEYFDARSEKFRKSLNAVQRYFSVQGLHDLFVEIRRIRELFSLEDYAAPSFAQIPDPSIFNDLFRATWDLRKIDICQSITLTWLQTIDLSEYFNRLKDQELRLRSAFSDTASEFPVSALSKTRPLIHSILVIQKKLNLQKKIRKRISKLAVELRNLTDNKKSNAEKLCSIYDSAELLLYKIETWKVCLDKGSKSADAFHKLEVTCNCLGMWRDLWLTYDSVTAHYAENAQKGLKDPTVYLNYREELMQQAGDSLAAYKRSLKPLSKSLKKLSEEL